MGCQDDLKCDISQENDIPAKIAKPASRALANAGLTSLGQVATLKLSELKKMHGRESKAIKILQTAMEEKGLSFQSE